MSDERLLARLRGRGNKDTIAAADRIEALTEQLEAARADYRCESDQHDATTQRLLVTEAKLAECLERNALLEARLGKAVEERDALKVTYDDIYADAMSDAESDARDFESDLWKGIRKLITELGFDWSGDVQYDGVPADEAVSFLRQAIEELEEKLRARTAERNHANDVTNAAIEEVNRLKALLAKAVEGLRESAKQHRIVAGMDLMGASSVAYNAARDAHTKLAEIEGSNAP